MSIRIGFADYYLDNWHCNQYPGFLREAIAKYGYDARVTHCFAMKDRAPAGSEGAEGVSSAEWAAERNMILCGSMEELIDSVDAVCVICADDASYHEEVARIPLMSGKPVFVDKTFAPDLETAKRMFALAGEYGTPVFSSSVERFNTDLTEYRRSHPGRPAFAAAVGPHSISRYAVHLLEPIVALMGTGAKRVKGYGVGDTVTQMIIDYGGGRIASFLQSPQPFAEFFFCVSEAGRRREGTHIHSEEDKYIHLAKAMLDFFCRGVVPVSQEETLEVMALIDLLYQVRERPDEWIEVAGVR